jgi:hypothetical protein
MGGVDKHATWTRLGGDPLRLISRVNKCTHDQRRSLLHLVQLADLRGIDIVETSTLGYSNTSRGVVVQRHRSGPDDQ